MTRWAPRIDRFNAKLAPAANGCIEWTGPRLPKGYGMFGGNGLAHRWIYMHTHGVALGRFDFVLHSCDNPPCVNIEHLRVGTAKENTADMYLRGREGRPSAPGERSGRAILGDLLIAECRARYAAGGITYRELAEEAGVCKSAMHAALTGVNWKHLPMPAPVR